MPTHYANVPWTKGLGGAAIYARVTRAAAPRFWDFVAGAWVAAETADCRAFMPEVATASAAESSYEAEVAIPAALCKVEIVELATGDVVGGPETVVPQATISVGGTIPVAPDPAMCTVYEYLRAQDGTPAAGATMRLRIVSLPHDAAGSLFTGAEVEETANAAGLIAWSMPRGARVKVARQSQDFGLRDREAVVPAAAEARLLSCVVP